MKIHLVSSENGYYDFDIQGCGEINRITINQTIAYGDIFNVYYGESSKEGGRWLGRHGIAGNLYADVKLSIQKTNVYQGQSN